MVLTSKILLLSKCKIQRVLLVTLGVHVSLIDFGATLRQHNFHNISPSDCKNTSTLDKKQSLFCSTLSNQEMDMESLEKAKELAANQAVDEYIKVRFYMVIVYVYYIT